MKRDISYEMIKFHIILFRNFQIILFLGEHFKVLLSVDFFNPFEM